jgi:hypothetical protein
MSYQSNEICVQCSIILNKIYIFLFLNYKKGREKVNIDFFFFFFFFNSNRENVVLGLGSLTEL